MIINSDIFLRYLLDFSSLYIAAVMCYVPVIKALKKPITVLLVTFGAISVFTVICSFICTVFSLESNILLLPMVVLLFALFYYTVKDTVSVCKAAFVFLTSALLTSVCVMLSVILNAAAETANTDTVCLAMTSLICLACEAVVCLAYCLLASRWVRWLVENFHYERIWRVVWIIPMGFTALYILIVPSDPATILVNRVYRISIILAVISFGAFFFSIFLFYRIAKEFVRNIRLERENRLLSVESRRYEQLRSYMEKSRRERHDFRQHIRVISGLCETGKTDELRQYISQYEKELGDERSTLCANAAVDAIAGYYDLSARSDNIDIAWQLALPKKLDIAESDICMALGNLVENAILTVKKLPDERHRINVICRMLSPAMIGIVVENPSTDMIMSDSRKERTERLESVRSVANKYHGEVMLEHDNNCFRVNVLLNL